MPRIMVGAVCPQCRQRFESEVRRGKARKLCCSRACAEARRTVSLADRMAAQTLPEPNSGCFLWTGALSKAGYGLIQREPGRGQGRAHRVSYEMVYGIIPDGLVIDHLCQNTACVNPTHLEATTAKENSLRGRSPRILESLSDRCQRGHAGTFVLGTKQRACAVCRRDRDRVVKRKARQDRALANA